MAYSWLRKALPAKNHVYRVLFSRLLPLTSPNKQSQVNFHNDLPSEAQIVICGGGVIGCSVAYHLSKLGWKDVILLEQGSLSCGTTWHAVGLVGKLKITGTQTLLSNYGSQLYKTLEDETGVATGYKESGALYVARTKDRMTLMKRNLAKAKLYDINVELVTPKEIQDMYPIELEIKDLQGGLWLPEEGTVNPSDLTQSLARGATMNGVKIFEKVELQSVVADGGVVRGVTTNKGDITCKVFVNCAGQWSRQVGQVSNPKVNVPLHSCEHFYIVSKSIKGVHSMMPNLRDQDGHIFIREWSGGLMGGGFEPISKPCFYEGIPQNFEFQLLPEDWDHFGVLMEQLLHRVPSLYHAEIRQLVNGPESFTPDGRYIIGEAPEVLNYFVGAGMNSQGIASAAGVGKVLSEWITEGRPTLDLWSVDIKRFSRDANSKKFLRERVRETLGSQYKVSFPYSEKEMARQVKCSPLYMELSSAGAVWGQTMEWERPNYFGEEKRGVEGFGRQPFFNNVQAEAKACNEGVGLVDMTSIGMFEISSDDNSSQELLQTLCCNDMSVPVGHIVHTAMLNEQGCYQVVCTVTRTNANSFLVQVPPQFITAAKSWVQRHITNGSSISLRDKESACVLGVLGPKSEELLQSLTQTPLNEEDFPLDSYKILDMGFASNVQVFRGSTSIGEDLHGWQLHIPTKFATGLYNQLITAGKPLGIKNAGYYALDSLYVIKGCPRFGVELGSFVNPFEAGLEAMVDINKEVDFIGKKAFTELKDRPITKRLVQIILENYDVNSIPWGGEPILLNGRNVGVTSSATISYLQDASICMAYVTSDDKSAMTDCIETGNYQVNVAGQLFSAEVVLPSTRRAVAGREFLP